MKKQWSDCVWDFWCCISGIGIWPRYIEPRLLATTRLSLTIPHLCSSLVDLKILQFSDLHWSNGFSSVLRKKLIQKINSLEADLILFTGDFLCCSKLENPQELKVILNSLKAKLGCFAILGNHDYSHFITLNAEGDYDIENPSMTSTIAKGFKRLFQPISLSQRVSIKAQQVEQHTDLINLLKQTPFQLLRNTTEQIAYQGSWINICGLEEYSTGKFNPERAFKNYNPSYPGIILSHNPDTIEILKHYPGDLILSGHTHGGQVNLPILWKRFTRIKHLHFKRGLKKVGEKWAYINRGISSVMKFRWFAVPELTLITLQKG